MKNYEETGICAICGKPYEHYGNNPEPLMEFENRVCDDCNHLYVIPARLCGIEGEQVKKYGKDAVLAAIDDWRKRTGWTL